MSTAKKLSTDEIFAIAVGSALLTYVFDAGWLSLIALLIGGVWIVSAKPLDRWLGFSLFSAALALFMLSFAYQVGADMAARDNARDSAAH